MEKVLHDELEHEDVIVTKWIERKISPEKIKNLFFGFNDGLVEILGAVSGFFAAFSNITAILFASMMVAVAGSISMGAGAYVAANSKEEIEQVEEGKRRFLRGRNPAQLNSGTALKEAIRVGVSYFIGAIIPVLPVALGEKNFLISFVAGGIMIIFVSTILAFLSGMDVRRRILINLIIIGFAVGVTYGIGVATKMFLGISL